MYTTTITTTTINQTHTDILILFIGSNMYIGHTDIVHTFLCVCVHSVNELTMIFLLLFYFVFLLHTRTHPILKFLTTNSIISVTNAACIALQLRLIILFYSK